MKVISFFAAEGTRTPLISSISTASTIIGLIIGSNFTFVFYSIMIVCGLFVVSRDIPRTPSVPVVFGVADTASSYSVDSMRQLQG